MERNNLEKFMGRHIQSRGKYYGTGAIFLWNVRSFSWLNEYWVSIQHMNGRNQGTNIWDFIRQYPWLFRERILSFYHIDLGYSPDAYLLEFFLETGLIVLSGEVSSYVKQQCYIFVKFVKEYFR